MEKAILRTLIYSDFFDYPLTLYEIHKWLIGRKTTLRGVEKYLKILIKKRVIKEKGGYYYFSRREKLIGKRTRRAKQSVLYKGKVSVIASMFKIIPWIKLVGISGGLSMENTDKKDDIDLFIITSKNRLWVSRFLILSLLSLTGQRRKAGETKKEVAGKICCNLLVDEENLSQRRDIYTAHEILQMKVLWERDEIYSNYLSENEWVFKFLPNWIGPNTSLRGAKRRSNLKKEIASLSWLAMTMEALSKKLQLKIMQKPKGLERIGDGTLYFHPNDIRETIIKTFKKRTAKI